MKYSSYIDREADKPVNQWKSGIFAFRERINYFAEIGLATIRIVVDQVSWMREFKENC